MRFRVDWFSVSRRLAQSPHLRLAVGSYRGRPALVTRDGFPLALSPKAALGVIADRSSLPLAA